MSIYQPVIGLEVHVELKTKSKMFCGCSADYFGAKPNTHTCPVCLGLPGALPVPNKKAIEWCVMIGLALNCEIPLFSKFDRKNYFYPDLPKGYQISQYDQPFAINGYVILGSGATPESDSEQARMTGKRIRIRRVHMEEDTAKLQHAAVNGEKVSLIDFNRSGVPLVEIVTEPDFETAEEVVGYLKKLQQIVRYLGVSDADMEKGQMRLEPNISLLPAVILASDKGARPESEVDAGQASMTDEIADPASRQGGQVRNDTEKDLPKYKVEVKNINSFRFVDKAIAYELKRQTDLLNSGKTPTQETRGWDEKKNITVAQRSKEEAHDYRYFPEPDIPPVRWTELQISNIKFQMPELPDDKFERFRKDFQLSDYDLEIIARDRKIADYFEQAVKDGAEHSITPKQIANIIINKKVDVSSSLPAQLIAQIVSSKQVAKVDKNKLEKLVKNVIIEHPKAVQDYKNGKESVIMFLVGQVMQKSKEKLDAKIVKEKLIEEIK